MSFVVGTMMLAVVTAIACALPGTFVVLRRGSMLVDAISHAVLPGIIVGFFFTHNLDSPFLVVGAALSGLLVVLGAEWLSRTGLLTGDAPQGLVFPALFSIGVILLSKNFAHLHLDTHVVLVGDLNLAALRQFELGGVSLGPAYMWVMAGALLMNALFLLLLYPQLKVTTFDPEFARTIGIRSGWLHTAFMFTVAITVTAAFNAAGAILVIALMVIPPATAFLLTKRLPVMLLLAVVIAAGGAVVGFWVAYYFDAPTSAGMSVFYGLVFAIALVVSRVLERHPHRVGRGAAEGE